MKLHEVLILVTLSPLLVYGRVFDATSGDALHVTAEAHEQLLCSITPPGTSASSSALNVYREGDVQKVSFGTENVVQGSSRCVGTSTGPCGQTSKGVVPDVADCAECPCELSFNEQEILASQKEMLHTVRPLCADAKASRPVDILNLGLGIGIMHQFFLHDCPKGTRVRSVELDQRMAGVASKYFGLELNPGTSEVVVGDAAGRVRHMAGSKVNSTDPTLGGAGFDIIAIDCFMDDGVTPPSVYTDQFIQELKLLLKPGGTIIHHMWHYSPKIATMQANFQKALGNYREVFGQGTLVVSIPRGYSEWDSLVISKAAGASLSQVKHLRSA